MKRREEERNCASVFCSVCFSLKLNKFRWVILGKNMSMCSREIYTLDDSGCLVKGAMTIDNGVMMVVVVVILMVIYS